MIIKTLRMAALCLAAASLSLATASARNLFSGGKTDYTIIIPAAATQWEKLAATELHNALQRVGGVDMPIVSSDNTLAGPAVYVGYCHAVDSLTGKSKPDDEDDSFTYFTAGDNLFIYGSSRRGTVFGVYDFLEREFGIRWYAPDCSVYPKTETYALREGMNHSESPALQYRMDLCDPVIFDNAYAMRCRNNMLFGTTPESFFTSYCGVHTMGWMVPASQYFESHPEYFALHDGKRIPDGQLCLSNPYVLRICTKYVLNWIAQSPGYLSYSVSQNDNQTFCECSKCKALEAKYGGLSGVVIRFVNQIAQQVKKQYPGVIISTLAYQKTQAPPTGIKLEDNLEIHLCTTDCCLAHPITDGCDEGTKDFLTYLKGWQKLTKRIFVWDYAINFYGEMAPFPNFHVLGPDMCTFRDNNCIGILEEADGSSAAAFIQMKSYVIGKLMWNPELNVDSLVEEFAHAYYGKAAPKILEYYQLCQDMIKPDTHINYFTYIDNKYYADPTLYNEGLRILNEAKQLADNDTIAMRVDCERLQPLYLKSMKDYEQAVVDGNWQELKSIVQELKEKWHFQRIANRFDMSIEEFFNNGERYKQFVSDNSFYFYGSGDNSLKNYSYGTAPGFVGNKQAYDTLNADFEAAKAIAATATSTEAEKDSIIKKFHTDKLTALKYVVPITDGIYYIQSGYWGNKVSGIKKSWFVPYTEGHVGWKLQETTLPFMWEVKKLADGNYSIKNLATGQYVNHSDVIDQDRENVNVTDAFVTGQTLTGYAGSGQFNIRSAGAEQVYYEGYGGSANATSGPVTSSPLNLIYYGTWYLTPVPDEELAAARRLVGINQTVAGDKASVDVYSADGVLVRKDAPAAYATAGLPKGIYVAGKRKVLVR